MRFPKTELPRIPNWKTVFDLFPKLVKFSRLLFFLSMGLVGLLYFYLLSSDLSKNLYFRTFLDSAFLVFFIFLGASFVPGSAVIKVLFLTICWSVIFARAAGDRLKPHEIEVAPLTRILFESEKDKVTSVEGKVIFDLDRYLLLNTGPKSVVAIPHEKIKSIQAPPLPQEQKIGGD